jgi:hypothetical protein
MARTPVTEHLSHEDQRVLTLKQWAALNGFSFMTAKRLIAAGQGPQIIQLSPRRVEACHMAGVEPHFVEYSGNDPVGFIIAANIKRRHLTSKQKSELVKKVLKLNREKSNRQIAATVKADHKTVAKERRKAVARREIPHVGKRTDAKGRRQPATKAVQPRAAKVTTPTVAPSTPPAYRESAKCLPEFKTACDHWLPKLNADDLKKARAYFQDRAEAREKSNGARATGSAGQSVEERRTANAKRAGEDALAPAQ